MERIWNVADILHQDGRWNLERLTTVLPPHIKEKIIQVHPQINVDVEDALAWKGSNSGVLTSKAFYSFITRTDGEDENQSWNWI